jgi:hypothetical protein
MSRGRRRSRREDGPRALIRRRDRQVLALPDHPDGGVVPARDEVLELGAGELLVRLHVVAVCPVLPTPERSGHPNADDLEIVGHRRVSGGRETMQDPAVVAVVDEERDRQVGAPQGLDRRSDERGEGRTPHEAIAIVDEVAHARRPAGRIDALLDGDVVAQVVAHVAEVTVLPGPAVVFLVANDVADDLDVGGRAVVPGLLGREDARPIQVDAAVPGRQRAGGRRGHEPSQGGHGQRQRPGTHQPSSMTRHAYRSPGCGCMIAAMGRREPQAPVPAAGRSLDHRACGHPRLDDRVGDLRSIGRATRRCHSVSTRPEPIWCGETARVSWPVGCRPRQADG